MDSPDFPAGKSPRRELQGPRPAPLKVRKDSHKIRKPPVAPQPQQAQHPPPVIIYTVSPKIIHTQPSEFMTLVQRLTGLSSSSSSSSSFSAPFDGGAVSPAARFASIEKTKVSAEEERKKKKMMQSSGDMDVVEGIEIGGGGVERTGLFPGILSPGPTSLPGISPNFFSPGFDPFSVNIFQEFSSPAAAVHSNTNKNYIEGSFMPSPSIFGNNKNYIEGSFMPSPSIFGNNKNYIEGSFIPSPSIFGNNKNYIEGSFFMPSPSTFLSTPHINPSPTPSLDLFNNFLD